MKRIIWADPVRDLLYELAESERKEILRHLKYLTLFPHMYPVRGKGKRFRRHRWFLAGNWLVYYRVAGGVVYISGLWAARIP
jgi:hypothetical protein